jgi:hypothetical protein
MLPFIRNVHNLLAGIRTDLTAARGEAVALDDLNVAQQATDFTGRSAFQNKTAAERFHLTVGAITGSLSALKGPSRENPLLQSLRGRLKMVKSIVNGLASRWLGMVRGTWPAARIGYASMIEKNLQPVIANTPGV